MNQALVHVDRSGANIFTIRNSSCGKVMFSHLSVSHSVHGGGGHAWQGVECMAGETAAAVDSMHPTGMYSCLFYVCMREGS